MDVCENVMPASEDLSNEMSVEVSNEMPVDLHNEMPVDGTNAENVEERHVVNGDSYASRAARTVSHEYPSRQERVRFSENVMPQRPFSPPVERRRPGRFSKHCRMPTLMRQKYHVCKGK